jgi:hypothetical protein
LRKFLLVVAVAALAGGTLTACIGGPAPEPTDPHDVLVVGDSVSFSLGCVLGDGGAGCDPRPGYTTHNEFTGGCTISPGTLSLYNGGQAGAPNCGSEPDAEGRTWANAADHYQPKVVVINTAGWEIVDRWLNFVAAPDAQWGDPGCTPQNVCSGTYQNAAVNYSSQLFSVINDFRARGAQVLVAESPYIQPLQPEPPPGTVPPGLECSWWEPYPSGQPNATGDPNNPLTCPGAWRSPSGNTTYRSSQTKIDQLNVIVDLVKNNNFGGDPGVKLFNFKKHFNAPAFPAGPPGYSDYVCPPPNDSTVAPNPITHQCAITNPVSVVPAVLARAVDHSHLSSAGQFQILQPYLEGCVKTMLGLANTPGDCS